MKDEKSKSLVVKSFGLVDGEDSLTRRASLTNLNGLIEQAFRVISGFIVSPFIIRSLGAELYGAWSMIGQLQGYLSLSDFRSGGTLKVLLAASQHDGDFSKKRRLVGAALFVGIASLSILLIVGMVLVFYSPWLFHTRKEYISQVRWALVLVLTSVAVTQVSAVAACSLRACNLDYKSLGLRSGVTAVVSGLGLVAVLLKTGIVGLAGAGLVGAVLMSWMWFVLARKHISWLGVERPSRDECRCFLSNSVWSMLVSLGQMVLVNSDILLVGAFLGPGVAGPYASTGALIRFLGTPVGTMISSAGPGLSGLCGVKDWERVGRVTHEIMALITLGFAVGGGVIVIINEQFIGVWAGQRLFIGNGLTPALVGLAWLQAMYRVAATLLDGVLELKVKGISLIAAAMLGAAGIAVSAKIGGATGITVLLGACLVGVIGYFGFILNSHLENAIWPLIMAFGRYALMLIVLLTVAVIAARWCSGWMERIIVGIIVGLVSSLSVLYLGMSSDVRNRLFLRIPSRLRQGIRS